MDRVSDYSLTLTPRAESRLWQRDPQANRVARALFNGRTIELRIDVAMTVDMTPINPFNILVEPSAEQWPFAYLPGVAEELAGMTACGSDGARFEALVERHRAPGRETLAALIELNRDVSRLVRYEEREHGEVLEPEETLRLGAGSCRDSTWLLVEALRRLGLASRFVSGYLLPISVPGAAAATPGEAGAGLHAWASAFIPGAGWVGLDPTSGTLCSEAHLPLVSAVHYRNAAPVDGTSEHPATSVYFEFEVTDA
jgi:transglutaminase-like putative cysteine protease